MKTKLWLLTQNVNIDNDTYDSCVVAADTEEDAKRIHPSKWQHEPPWDGCSWVNEPDEVRAREIGITEAYVPGAIVISSFNAG